MPSDRREEYIVFLYNVRMPETLLRTKLYIPPLRPNLVPRPHLIERLNRGLQLAHKLTLISAPAGFGKTTLVGEWVGNLRLDNDKKNQTVYKIAWLSLDESDNDPARFLAYLVAALNQAEETETAVGKGVLGMIQSPQPPPTEDVLASLLNDISTIPDRFILALDDYHVIESTPVDEALAFLLDHLPTQMHLVIATRDDPQLPLARLRARGHLAELRAADLRFTSTEAAEFLNKVMGLALSEEDIAALETRTEGWIAGLQLAAISMQGRKDTTSLINSFTGSHRFVLDYLIEEVLEQQTASIQTFLMQTAVLDRMTGSLCDALTGQTNGQATLELLEHTNLFITPLDEERRWYRYHHLFTDLLRQRQRQNHMQQIPMLHIRASEWYEKNGFTAEAIDHALHAENFERAAHLIQTEADAIWQCGEHSKLQQWLIKLPDELVCSKPQLCIFHAWYLFASGQQGASEMALQAVEQALDFGPDHANETDLQERGTLTSSDRVQLRGRAAAIRAFMDSYLGDVLGLIQHARLALEYLPEQDSAWRSITAIVLGDAQGFKGDMKAAYKARFEALKVCQAAGEIYYAMLASMKLAITVREQGQLQRTIEICQQQVQLANEYGLLQTSLNGLLWLIEGEVLAELNNLDGATHLAKKGLEQTKSALDLTILGWGYMCQLRILFSSGNLGGIETVIQKLRNIARESHMPPWLMKQMETWQIRTWLIVGNLEAASYWVQESGLGTYEDSKPLHEIDFFSLFDYILLARVLMAQGQLGEAVILLQHLLEVSEAGGRTSRMIEILLVQALAHQAHGSTDQAINKLEHAFTLAEPEGFTRIFVEEGEPMAHLLHEALNRGIAPDYVRRLLAAYSEDEPTTNDNPISQADQSEWVEPLSERELEVLQRIAEGLTNRQIADRLFLSLNTVKVHTRNIYGKLGVHNRTQAVARARALDILPSI